MFPFGHSCLKRTGDNLVFLRLVSWGVRVALFLMPALGQAATLFVATNGSDSTGNGNLVTPWRTIQFASSKLSGGDTLNVRSGTYVETNWVWQYQNWKSGTPAAPTVIQAFQGETVTWRQNDATALEVIRVGGTTSNVVFSGFILDNQLARSDVAGTTVVKLTDNCSRIMITNCVIMNSPRGHGLLVNTATDTPGSHRIIDCLFTNTAWNSQVGDSPPHCAYIQSASNILERCVFEKGFQDFCIHNYSPDALGNVYRGNVFRNAGRSVGLVAGGWNQVYNNLFYSNVSAAVSIHYGSFSNQVINNTIWRNKGGIILDQCFGNSVENNLVSECFQSWAIAVNDIATNTVLRNNLSCSNQVYWAGESLYIHGVGTVTNANKFGDAYSAGLYGTPPGFKLISGSDAIAAGRVQGFFTNDLAGKARTGTWDIGAFEYSLISPSNLRPIGP